MAISLLELAEDQVFTRLYEATRSLEAPFSIGGTLGSIGSVKLAVAGEVAAAAVAGAAAGAAAGPAGPEAEALPPARVMQLPEDLQALLAECSPAQFGRGSETVLDPSYRAALALPAARIFTQNLEGNHLSGVLAAISRLLLPAAGPLSMRLHALNAYSSGGFFKSHRDTPRGDPGFVGSLVVCLPVGHEGGGLRVAHSGRSVLYEWGPGAAAGEVQWAAFFPDCEHEVLPVTSGTRVALAFELFARPDTTSGPPAPLHAVTGAGAGLLHMLRSALANNSFLVNGGRLGFACQHAYPQSLAKGVDQELARSMLKGTDAVVLHVLQELGVPASIVRVWEEDTFKEWWLEGWEFPDSDIEEGQDEETAQAKAEAKMAALERRFENALVVGPLKGGAFTMERGGERPTRKQGGEEGSEEWLEQQEDAKLDLDIFWLGGKQAFPEWTLGSMGLFWGNEGQYPGEFYCALGIVAEVPPYADRPADRPEAALGWVGKPADAPSGSGGTGSDDGDGGGGSGSGKKRSLEQAH